MTEVRIIKRSGENGLEETPATCGSRKVPQPDRPVWNYNLIRDTMKRVSDIQDKVGFTNCAFRNIYAFVSLSMRMRCMR